MILAWRLLLGGLLAVLIGGPLGGLALPMHAATATVICGVAKTDAPALPLPATQAEHHCPACQVVPDVLVAVPPSMVRLPAAAPVRQAWSVYSATAPPRPARSAARPTGPPALV